MNILTLFHHISVISHTYQIYFNRIIKKISKRNIALLNKFLLCAAILFFSCNLTNSPSNEKILARIGDKEISVKEFLRRSELTIRPNQYKDKLITLNNLIYEKIIALEAAQNDKILPNPVFESTLKGIKEQLMREKLYYEVAFNKVELDTNEVKNVYRASQREYKLEFYTIRDKEQAEKIRSTVNSLPTMSEGIFQELETIVGKKPVEVVGYLDQNDDVIRESLFSNLLDNGTVIGPLQLTNGQYIFMKVLNWVDHPLVSSMDQQIRWNKVNENLRVAEARILWRTFQASVMSGKKIEFDENTFEKLTNVAFQFYANQSKNDSLHFQLTEIPSGDREIKLNDPFFTIDNSVWSVGEFKKELMSHPLVFRTKYLNKHNFPEQFKLAIVDLVKDHYLTQEAYQRDLDRDQEVRKIGEMWNDAYLANQQMKNIINTALVQGIISKDDNQGISKYWESYLVDLQSEYRNVISVDYNELDKISLTNIDYYAIKPGVPYPIPMPNFPTLTVSTDLDYALQ